VFLRGWGEWYHHSLVLTEAAEPGLGHLGWRTLSSDHLTQAVARVQAAGADGEWVERSVGHGPAYRFRAPGGHVHELFWEVERYVAPPELASTYPNRPQAYRPRGIAARQVDHVTVMTADVLGDAYWYRDTLGYTFTEYTTLDEADVPVFAMLTNNEKSHDLGLIIDQSGVPGRLHHVSYWVDSRDELLRAADILMGSGAGIEFGPGRHGMGEQDYLYTREPGGVRVEINTGGYRLYVPDWQTVKWTPAQGSNVFYRNIPMPESMMQATPHVDQGAPDDATVNPWAAASVH
jgi:catechol 2,3-dioxygenase